MIILSSLLMKSVSKANWMYSPCSAERAGAISERVTRMIIKDLRPIIIFSGEGFRDLMAFMEPEYRLPSTTHFTHLIEQRYEVVKEKMRGILQNCADSVAITADIWLFYCYYSLSK